MAAASPTLATPSQPVEERACRLISGLVALSAQVVLLVVVVTALFVKRLRERPRRPWSVWVLDIGKQACSGGAGHTVGMAVAILAHARTGQASECGWYFVVYFLDCTLGLTLSITFLKLTIWLTTLMLQRRNAQLPLLLSASSPSSDGGLSGPNSPGGGSSAVNDMLYGSLGGHSDSPHSLPHSAQLHAHLHPWWETLTEIGHYGDAAAPNLRKWGVQVAVWVGCVVCARSCVGLCVLLLAPGFQLVTAALDLYFRGRPDTYLYTVMVAIPLVVNVGQAWIQDQVLKWKHKRAPGSKRGDTLELPSDGPGMPSHSHPHFQGSHAEHGSLAGLVVAATNTGQLRKGGPGLMSTLLGGLVAKTNDE
ncbi:hypothetical protein V8C86DRAFT_1816524 [Haematococcus lacustris]|nr:hypothetical protein QJQ45_021141 [Haematococcus lacustris]